MEPGAALPPEVYRLNAHRLPWAKGRARRRRSVLVALAAAAATGLSAMDATSLRAAFDAALAVAAIAAVVAPFALWSAGRSVRRSWNAFELAIGPNSLRVATPREPRTIVQRADVVRIVERVNGLHVRTAVRAVRAHVPADVEAYGDIRARLAGWSPIVQRWDPRGLAGTVALTAAVAGCSYLALFGPLPAVAAAGLVFATAIGVFAGVDVALQPALGSTTKVIVTAVLAAGLFTLVSQALQRL